MWTLKTVGLILKTRTHTKRVHTHVLCIWCCGMSWNRLNQDGRASQTEETMLTMQRCTKAWTVQLLPLFRSCEKQPDQLIRTPQCIGTCSRFKLLKAIIGCFSIPILDHFLSSLLLFYLFIFTKFIIQCAQEVFVWNKNTLPYPVL